MTDERKPGDEGPVEAWDDEGGAAEGGSGEAADETAAEAADGAAGETAGEAVDEGRDEVDRAKRWADEQTGHWHGATSSDAKQGRGDEE